MSSRISSTGQRAFALLLTLTLLALVVLVTFALGALVKVDTQMSVTATYQTQARQNASLALGLALGALQRHAGDDARITGMAGISGVAFSQGATTRYWCGVWEGDGRFVAWLVSGAGSLATAGPDAVELISAGTVGLANASAGTPNVEKVHVVANKVPVTTGPVAAAGVAATAGAYAYLVIDEGTKIGAHAPVAQRPLAAAMPVIGSSMLVNQLKLKSALEANAPALTNVLTYEQLAVLPGSITPHRCSRIVFIM